MEKTRIGVLGHSDAGRSALSQSIEVVDLDRAITIATIEEPSSFDTIPIHYVTPTYRDLINDIDTKYNYPKVGERKPNPNKVKARRTKNKSARKARRKNR